KQDRKVESRYNTFVHEADGCLIFCKSKRAAERTKAGIIRYIADVLYLRVNEEKTHAGYVRDMKFLGYSFYIKSGECRLSVHRKSYGKLKARLKELTGRSNGMGYEKRKIALRLFINGWLEYFKLADIDRKST